MSHAHKNKFTILCILIKQLKLSESECMHAFITACLSITSNLILVLEEQNNLNVNGSIWGCC